MNRRKRVETDRDLLNILEDFFCDDIEDEPIESIDADLQALGYDPNDIAIRLGAFARDVIQKSPLNWRNKSQEIETAREKLLTQSLSQAYKLDRHELIDEIKKRLSNHDYASSGMLPVFNRNFHEMSDNDLRSLLQQLDHMTQKNDSSGDK